MTSYIHETVTRTPWPASWIIIMLVMKMMKMMAMMTMMVVMMRMMESVDVEVKVMVFHYVFCHWLHLQGQEACHCFRWPCCLWLCVGGRWEVVVLLVGGCTSPRWENWSRTWQMTTSSSFKIVFFSLFTHDDCSIVSLKFVTRSYILLLGASAN